MSLKRSFSLLLAVGLLQPNTSVAFTNDCSEAASQMDLDVCYSKEYSTADEALNETYG